MRFAGFALALILLLPACSSEEPAPETRRVASDAPPVSTGQFMHDDSTQTPAEPQAFAGYRSALDRIARRADARAASVGVADTTPPVSGPPH